MDFILSSLQVIVPFVIVLTILVFVHEMGHYLVARWNGVRVEVFSIGFGPEIFGWNDKVGTRWKIAWVPLGGYVKFFGDMDAASGPNGEIIDNLSEAERKVSFHHKRVGQRAAIVAAGPIANFIYAILVLAVLYFIVGLRMTPPEIGMVLPNSPAAKAGILSGDHVRAINGRSILRFEEMQEEVMASPGLRLTFEISRGGVEKTLYITPDVAELTDQAGTVHKVGSIGLLPIFPAKVGRVIAGSPAENAGLLKGDRILSFDGQAINSFHDLQKKVLASGGRSLRLGISRDGKALDLRLRPRAQERKSKTGEMIKVWRIGVMLAPPDPVKLGPLDAVREAYRTSYLMIFRTIEYLGQMFAGERGTEDLGGPLRIAQQSGQAAQFGIERLVFWTVLLSLNLGFINLLPIPMLDGGHLTFYIYEALRGRPLNERIQEYAMRIGMLLILSLMVFATWNDLVNLRVIEAIAGWFS